MEPISTVAAAVVLGVATTASNTTVSEIVKDAYKFLKSLVKRERPNFDFVSLEKQGSNTLTKDAVQEMFPAGREEPDPELLQAAREMIVCVIKHAPEVVAYTGINLKGLTGANLKIDNVTASGMGVAVEGANMTGDIQITNVRAGVKF